MKDIPGVTSKLKVCSTAVRSHRLILLNRSTNFLGTVQECETLNNTRQQESGDRPFSSLFAAGSASVLLYEKFLLLKVRRSCFRPESEGQSTQGIFMYLVFFRDFHWIKIVRVHG